MLSEFIQKKRIGTLLLEKKLVTQEQLEWALLKQRENKKLLGEILVEAGFISEDVLCKMLALQFGVPFIQENDINVNPELFRMVPDNLIKMRKFVPLKLDTRNEILTIIISDPNNFVLLDHVKNVMRYHVKYVLASSKAIEKAIDNYFKMETIHKDKVEQVKKAVDTYRTERKISRTDIAKFADGEQDEKYAVNLLNSIIAYAIGERASDIHLESLENSFRIRYRIDGVLTDETAINKAAEAALLSRLKIMAEMDIAEKMLPQDGNFTLNIDLTDIDFRVGIALGAYGENAAIRILNKSSLNLDITKMGMDEGSLRIFRRNVFKSHGLVLITGPAGSGKTTTLYAALNTLNSDRKKIVTIENPVEYHLNGVHQMQVFVNKNDPTRSLTFESGLKSALRLDPDVIMVGEIREPAVLETAVSAAMTGHLVFSTLHANTTTDIISRLEHLGVEPSLFIATFNLVVNQRLLKKVCRVCRENVSAQSARNSFENAGLNFDPFAKMTFVEGKGCPNCSERGCMGRTGIYELLDLNDEIKSLILERRPSHEIKKKAIEKGMKTLKVQALEKARAHEIPFSEFIMALINY